MTSRYIMLEKKVKAVFAALLFFSLMPSFASAETLSVQINASVSGGVEPTPTCVVEFPDSFHFGELGYISYNLNTIDIDYDCSLGTNLSINRVAVESGGNVAKVGKLFTPNSNDYIPVYSTEDLSLTGTGAPETANMTFSIHSSALNGLAYGEYSGIITLNVVY